MLILLGDTSWFMSLGDTNLRIIEVLLVLQNETKHYTTDTSLL